MLCSRYCLLAVTIACFSLGCGGGPVGADGLKLANVEGVVTLDGEPAKFAFVTFNPIDGGRSSSAETDAEGRYELVYSASMDGAEVGDHSVSIASQEGGEPDFPDDFDQDTASQAEIDKYYAQSSGTVIPDRYAGGAPELAVSVVEGSNTHNFDLTSGE